MTEKKMGSGQLQFYFSKQKQKSSYVHMSDTYFFYILP